MSAARIRPPRRAGFTLIELLVVISLMMVIFALGIGYVVFGQDNQHSVTGAQQLTGWLLNAKQRAKRDGATTGVRILWNGPTNPATQLEFTQQPDDYTTGNCTGTAGASVNVVAFAGVDFQGGGDTLNPGEWTVQPGDYLAGGVDRKVHQIIAPVTYDPTTQTGSLTLASPVVFAAGPYRILRAPRRLPSEDILTLPPTVGIDPTLSQYSNGLPVTDIQFATSGVVVGQGSAADKIYLWMRDPTQNSATAGAPLILSIQTRTGFIGVYPVAPWDSSQPISAANDPYAFVKDPRASGF